MATSLLLLRRPHLGQTSPFQLFLSLNRTIVARSKRQISTEARFRVRHEWNLPISAQLANRTVSVLEVTRDGGMSKVSKDLSEFSFETGVPHRDLVSLRRKARVGTASLSIRGQCWLTSVSHVRAVVSPAKLYLFQPDRPIVRDFGRSMSEYLPAYYTALEKERELGVEENVPLSEDVYNVSFQSVVIEGVLSSVSQKYNRRVAAYTVVVDSMLQELLNTVIQGEDFDKRSTINHLLALRNSLTRFERSNESVIDCLEKLLESDIAMYDDRVEPSKLPGSTKETTAIQPTTTTTQTGLFMKDNQQSDNSNRELDGVEEKLETLETGNTLRLVVETYLRDFAEYSEMSFRIRQKIRATNDLVEHELDRQRNIIMATSVELSKIGVSLTFATVTAGLFGMNLMSGFENSTYAFYIMAPGSLLGCYAVYLSFNRWASKSLTKPSSHKLGRLAQQQQRLDTLLQSPSLHSFTDVSEHTQPKSSNGQSVLEDGSMLDEIQDMVLSFLEEKKGDKISKEEVHQLLIAASGKQFTMEEVDHIFAVFDHNHDGFLDAPDMVNFMCSEYG